MLKYNEKVHFIVRPEIKVERAPKKIGFGSKRSRYMDPKHKEVLRILRKKILDNASDVERLVDQLYSRNVLTDYHKDSVLGQTLKKSQLKVLLDILKTRGKSAFQQFVLSLKICEDDELAADLAKAGQVSLTEDEQLSQPEPESNVKDAVKKYDDWPKPEHLTLSYKIVECEYEAVRGLLCDKDVYNITKHKKKALFWIMRPEMEKKLFTENTKFESTFKKILTDATVNTRLFNRLKAEDIVKTFTDKLKKENLKEYGCFILVAVTCGPDSSKVYDVEGQEVDFNKILQEIKNCPELKDTPKVVIIHTYYTPGALPAVSGREQSESDATEYAAESSSATNRSTECTLENDDDFNVIYTKYRKDCWIPGKAETPLSTWFLQCLTYVMTNYSNSLCFMDIIDRVNLQLQHAIVGEGKTDSVAEVVYLHKCCKKKLFFFPGIKANPREQQ